MDNSANNRYQLLFMDDDINDSLDNIAIKTKNQSKNTVGGGSSAQRSNNKPKVDGTSKSQLNKTQNQAEKENKPSAINKNDVNKISINSVSLDKVNKQNGAPSGSNVNRRKNSYTVEIRDGQQVNLRKPNLKYSGETREQRINRQNVKETSFNNNITLSTGGQQQSSRQFRDRENRGPPRNKTFDSINRIGKREFDRQSGSDKTGVKSIDKRDGAGAFNWGSVKGSIDDINKNETDRVEILGEKGEELGNEQVEMVPPEEESKELTLDEWKAQKQQRAKPIFNIRKAGEGEDTSQWKKMIILNNTKKKETESEEELEFDPALYPQRVGRQQRVLDIQFNFNDGRRGGSGFGNRGRGRGPRSNDGLLSNAGNIEKPHVGRNYEGARGNTGRSGGTDRGSGSGRSATTRPLGTDRPQHTAPKVTDESQFPTLI